MRHQKIKFVVIISCIGLILSGCYKVKSTASANLDGTLTGSFTIETTKADYQSLLDEINLSLSDEITQRYEVVNITLDANSLSNCEVSDVTFEFEGATPRAENLSFSYTPDVRKNSLFVTGRITDGGDSDGYGHLYIEKGVIVPASGNIADCENFGNISTGKLMTFNDGIANWNFGSLKDVRQSPSSEEFNFTPSLLLEQFANLPYQERGLYLVLLELLLAGEMMEWSDSTLPEFKQCSNYHASTKFNALSYRTFDDGEFYELVNSFAKLKVKETSSIFSVTCNFTNISLEYFDRGKNEPSASQDSAIDEGYWLSNEEGLVWDFEMDADLNLEYSYAVNDSYYTVVEIDPDNVADGAEAFAFDTINRTLYKNVYSINGVILDTNGSMSADNKITFVNRPWHSDGTTIYYLKGFKPTKYNMRSILGRVVEFKSNSSKISTSQGTLQKYVEALLKEKKKHVEIKRDVKKQLVITGIYNAALQDQYLEANMLLVEKRVKALQTKLKKLGWKAQIATGYVPDNDAASGDPKAKNKAVIQFLPMD